MGKRSTSRRLAMQTLFQVDVSGNKPKKIMEMLFDEEAFIDDTKDFCRKLVQGTLENIAEIDKKISEFSTNWTFDRIGGVDKSILRLSIFELLYYKENPSSVVINEAIELAKKYSDEESAKFINGILGAIVTKAD